MTTSGSGSSKSGIRTGSSFRTHKAAPISNALNSPSRDSTDQTCGGFLPIFVTR